jgi:hypothetical protein
MTMMDFDAIVNEAIAELPAPGVPSPEEAALEGEVAVEEKPAGDQAEAKPETGETADGEAKEESAAAAAEPGDKATETPAAAAAETPPRKTGDEKLARRLDLVAREERRLKTDRARREAEDAKVKPAVELVEKVRATKATSKVEAARLALELDDEGEAELYLELHEKVTGGGAKVDPEAKLEQLVDKKVEAREQKREQARKDAEARELEEGRTAYAAELFEVLDARKAEFPVMARLRPPKMYIAETTEAIIRETGEVPAPAEVLKVLNAYPLCAMAPPGAPIIAAISAEITRAEGKRPSRAKVLETIEEHRREVYEATGATRKPEQKPVAAKTAPDKGEPGGKQTPPIRRNDVPVTTSTKRLSHEEALEAEIAALQQTQ